MLTSATYHIDIGINMWYIHTCIKRSRKERAHWCWKYFNILSRNR